MTDAMNYTGDFRAMARRSLFLEGFAVFRKTEVGKAAKAPFSKPKVNHLLAASVTAIHAASSSPMPRMTECGTCRRSFALIVWHFSNFFAFRAKKKPKPLRYVINI